MTILTWGALALVVAFLIHLVYWRVRLPERQTRALFLLFSSVLGVTVLTLFSFGVFDSWIEYLYFGTFYFCIMMPYIISYPAIEAESPSSLLLMALDQAGSAGLPRPVFDSIVTNELFVENRIHGLVQARHVILDGGDYRITAKGRSFLAFFLFPRRVMISQKVGG